MSLIKILIQLWLVFMLVACNSSRDLKLEAYIDDVKRRPPIPIASVPDYEPLATFIYPESDSRRSPFKAKISKQYDALAPNMKRVKETLEHFPLDALKFVGILKKGSIVWALIKDPTGLVTPVKVGAHMGQDYGRIGAIKDNVIELDNFVRMAGKWERKKLMINLKGLD